MARTFEGRLVDPGGRIAIVAARFNQLITARLLEGACDALRRHGVGSDRVDVVWVPGGFELPLACQKLAKTGNYTAIIAVGCVIRGATAHFDYVAGAAATGVSRVSLDTGVPVLFGVLTTETIEQAIERAGTKAGNAGYNAAVAAIETANLLREIG